MSLEKLIKNHVKSIEEIPELQEYFNGNELKVSKRDVLNAIKTLREQFNEDIIIYGGIMVYPEILGYKKHIRKPSTDIDCVLKNLKGVEEFYYIKDFDTGLKIVGNVPVSFSYKHIHDFSIPQDFYKDAIKVDGASYCNPSYLIMMKLRRRFPKDYLDIASLLASEKANVDIEKTINLIKNYITSDKEKISKLFQPLKKYSQQIPKKDRKNIYNFLSLTETL